MQGIKGKIVYSKGGENGKGNEEKKGERRTGGKDCLLRIQFMQHIQRFQFGEAGDVEAVVFVQDVENALAGRAREAEDVHGGIVHAEKGGQKPGFFVAKEVGMEWLAVGIAA